MEAAKPVSWKASFRWLPVRLRPPSAWRRDVPGELRRPLTWRLPLLKGTPGVLGQGPPWWFVLMINHLVDRFAPD